MSADTPKGGRPAPKRDAVEAALIAAAAAGAWLTTAELCARFGVSQGTVWAARSRVRATLGYKGDRVARTTRALAAAGARPGEIAQQLRRSGTYVRAALATLALLLLLTTTTTTSAQPREVRSPPLASWWMLPHQEPAPIVAVTGGAGATGGGHCAEAGGPCVVWAQGDWLRVTADGALIAERTRVYLLAVQR